MKNKFLEKRLFVYLFLFTFAIGVLSSCDDDEEDNSYDYVQVATLKLNSDSTTFYYILNDGTSLYPSILSSAFDGYKPVDSTRCIIWYKLLNNVVAGYDNTAKVVRENEVLTLRYVESSPSDSLANDTITLESQILAGGFLDIRFLYPKVDNKADIDLVHVATADSDNYTHFKLCFNNGGNNSSSYMSDANVSFNLGDLDPKITGKDGIKFTANTFGSGEVEYPLSY